MSIHKELQHLGETIKQRRLEKNLTLKEIENALSIRINFLTAIEEGQVSKLISPIYAQGFIKKYASFLDFDSESLLKEHPFVLRVLTETADNPEFPLGLGSVEMRGSPAGDLKWLPNIAWVAGSALFLLVAWFVAKAFDLI